MKITTIGRGTIGGTLGRLWKSAGHEVTELGHEGGDAAGSDVVLLAVPYAAVPDALAGVTGLADQVVIDASNRLDGGDPPAGYASNTDFVRAKVSGPVAKAFNLNFGSLLDQAADSPTRPQSIWVGEEGARAAVEQLIRDAAMEPVNAGSVERAATQEAFALMLIAMIKDIGDGPLFYRFAAPAKF